MSARELVLHIGAHKTGTSAIQVFLRTHRAELQARGHDIVLPPTPDGRPANWNFMFRLDPGPVFRLTSHDLQTLVRQIEANPHKLILSSEEFFWLEVPEIATLSAALRAQFDRIHLVAYVRRQDRMAISHWYQAAKTRQSAALFGNPAGPLIDLPPAAMAYLDYATRLEEWMTYLAPEEITCRIYDRTALIGGDAVTDFLQAVGLEGMAEPDPKGDTNAALGTEATFLIHELRAAGRRQSGLVRLIQSGLLPKGTPGGLPARADAEAFQAHFAHSNARLAALPGLEGHPPLTFSDDFSSYPETATLPRFDAKTRSVLMPAANALLRAVNKTSGKPLPKGVVREVRPGTEKTILLHVGAHKTGSSTIQGTLYRHRKKLLKNGIAYVSRPNFDWTFFAHFSQRIDHQKMFPGRSPKDIRAAAAERASEVETALRETDADIVIVSSENLSLLMDDGMQQLRDFFAPHGKIRVAYFYRDLLPWMSSHSQQRAKVGRGVGPLDYSSGILRLYDIPKRLHQTFGAQNVSLMHFQDVIQMGLTNALLRGLDVPPLLAMGIQEVRRNDGISAPAVELMYLYNHLIPLGDPRRDDDLIEAIRALPGQKYEIAGISAEEHADYAQKYPEMTGDLGLTIASPEEVPISEAPDQHFLLLQRILQLAEAEVTTHTSGQASDQASDGATGPSPALRSGWLARTLRRGTRSVARKVDHS